MNNPHALRLSPSRTVVTSFNPRQTPAPTANDSSIFEESYYDGGDWVLCVAASPVGHHNNHANNVAFIGCALSNGEVQIYDPQRLHNTHTFSQAHQQGAMITDLVRASPHQQQQFQNLLVSSGTDGRICAMDLRTQQQQSTSAAVVQASLPLAGEQALSVSLGYDGYLVAVGSNKAKVHFFDLRQTNQLLGSYVHSHTDEITRVCFHPSNNNALLTASEDGLACIFDTSQPTEEAALKSVMNAQTPLRQVGFFGPNLEGIYCLTGSETMSLWSWDSAQCLLDDRAIRATLGGVDYLVNAVWDAGRQELQLVAGCSNGDTCLSTLDASSKQQQPLALKTTHAMAGGHRGVVRDWCPITSSVLVTVGEDARLCEWNLMGRQWNAASSSKAAAATTTANNNSPMTRRWSGTNSNNNKHENGGGRGGGPLRRQRNKRTSGPY